MNEQSRKSNTWPIIGQDVLGKLMIESFRLGTWPAFAMFIGPHQVGKQTAAVWIAKRDLCDRPQAPCGQCEQCRAVDRNQHPRCRILSSGDQDISIDDIRAAQRLSLYTRGQDESVWVIIADADQLTEGAVNALLKTTEEPSPSLRMIMTTSYPSRIPPTLRSRSAVYRWHLVPPSTLTDALRAQYPEVGEPELRTIIARAAGRPGMAIQVLSLKTSFEPKDDWGKALSQFALTDDKTDTADQQLARLEERSSVIRDILLRKVGVSTRLRYPELAEQCTRQARQLPFAVLYALLYQYAQRYDYLHHHVAAKTLVHDALMV